MFKIALAMVGFALLLLAVNAPAQPASVAPSPTRTHEQIIFPYERPNPVGEPVPLNEYFGKCPPFPCPACIACITPTTNSGKKE